MELGQKLKQARLEAGLSQRQLCGDYISRNMLSLIENGSARPSMDTLRYFSQMLGKPISFFLEEDAVTSPNQALMTDARKHFQEDDPENALQVLSSYRTPDACFDWEYYLLTALSACALAEKAIQGGKTIYAQTLLEQAETAAQKTPYWNDALQRKLLLLSYRLHPESAPALAQALPDDTESQLLRAEASLAAGDPMRCRQILDAADSQSHQWHFLYGQACLLQKDYPCAAKHFTVCQEHFPRLVYPRLEQCYRELGDYEKAYFWACKQRSL